MSIRDRKREHIEISLTQNVNFRSTTTWLEKVLLEYSALPEIDLDDVCLETDFLGKKLKAPLMVSGMVGGIEEAKQINRDIAKACESLGIAFGVGSQRAMLENPQLKHTYFVRDVAPNIFVAGNLGVTQLKDYSLEQIEYALESIGADALAIHINAAQESIQPEGTPRFKGCLKKIDEVSKKLSKPVYVKEVGHGVSFRVAQELAKTNIKAIDVQGAGGTSWTAIEFIRNKSAFGETFWDFGIPTASSVAECRKAFKGIIIASGGIRSGLDAVKSFVLGANMVAIAKPVLEAQAKGGHKEVENYLSKIIHEIKVALFLIGAKSPKEAVGRGRLQP
ncbi:MAG: type 2 isopentenyl-diphosphate Delta-isomerase [Candidatus Diapherotrites archaeon]|nr:type 2 isopentenyl-diphosphate Delta-isomerase [Candidatus Diapherotrites archaeon]